MGLFNGGDGAVAARFNGSPWHQTKIPDLHILRYSRYIDATGTHRFVADQQRKSFYRYADGLLYSIGVYLMSLEPAKNPNPAPPARLAEGRKIFDREVCLNSHSAPDYTSGKLTLAMGYKPPDDHPDREMILRMTARLDPGLALQTRKGTGFYKIPSLRGVWYRPRLLHDGSVAILEELFNPARLHPDHVPGGWKGQGGPARFGLSLKEKEKADLLAFLRSL